MATSRIVVSIEGAAALAKFAEAMEALHERVDRLEAALVDEPLHVCDRQLCSSTCSTCGEEIA